MIITAEARRDRIERPGKTGREMLRLARLETALGEDRDLVVEGKTLGLVLRMAVVAAEAERRAGASRAAMVAYWRRVWEQRVRADALTDFDDVWIAMTLGDLGWSDHAPKAFERLSQDAEDGRAERDSQTALTLNLSEEAVEAVLMDRGLASEGSELKFRMRALPGRRLDIDALAFSANLFDLANLAGRMARGGEHEEDGGDFFRRLFDKRKSRDAQRNRLLEVLRRTQVAARAYAVTFDPRPPVLLGRRDLAQASTAELSRIARRAFADMEGRAANRPIPGRAAPAPGRIVPIGDGRKTATG